MEYQDTDTDSAFGFDGTWKEFAPIAFTNLLLTIVTLGIYRFWATARERRYLWSRSRFVDERLEWAGTGMELFIGFLLVTLLFGLPFVLINFALQALAMRGEQAWAGALTLVLLLGGLYLVGLARYRALRYRLSRTRWRGIRGGSNDPGFKFGFSYLWKTIAAYIPLGLLVPWSMTSLWNQKWREMSFGPYKFDAHAEAGPVFARYLLFYLAPVVIFAFLGLLGSFAPTLNAMLEGQDPTIGLVIGLLLFLFIFYGILGIIAVAFYSAFYREAVGSTTWGHLQFSFGASTMDWIKLIIGDAALVVFTLGIGWIFLSYRHWKFFMIHLEAGGEILLDELTQSTTATAKHGEGLLESFDIGAI
ncbi:YjgN family protein [Qipengyuania atrilutea]|uniref:DUF898 domain-containing protein n=1 Tax=Qipengyuania atrilutea TaxID=2744473 RepID=A0A850H1M0_9SPHN|nr:YjgN family protein [Actirhodobacter atriluteus]NVD44586.1 DUF898 domain-containing protein [Actirhodobacter atriluteus]